MMDDIMPRHYLQYTLMGILAAGATVALVLAITYHPASAPVQHPQPRAQTARPVTLPPANSADALPGISGLADPVWVAATAKATGIPPRALQAYAGATLAKAASMPLCGLGWTTLAAIGAVESDHGRHGGSTVTADGTVVPGIYGVALDGAGTAHIPDSDGGKIDGDTRYDRAVGPMQLIPQAWRNWHVDGNGDGVEDPQNIDDAVLAAANYLCRASADMSGAEGWRVGIAAYNSSGVYRQSVADAANDYADAVR